MKCDCKLNIEARLLTRFKDQTPEANDHSVSLDGYGLAIIDNSIVTMPYMPIKLTANHPLKKGGFKRKTENSNMFFNYCPFCGVKVEKATS